MGMFLRLWNSKPVVLVRAIIDIYGILKTLGAVSLSAVLGAFAPALVELGLNLSTFQKWVIGLGVFFIILAGVTAFLDRLAQGAARETNSRQVQKDKIKQLQEHNKHLNSEIEERDTTHANRVLLKYALEEAQEEGNLLRKGEPTKAAVERWESRTRALIEAALGEGHTNHFLSDDGAFPLATPNPTGAQYQLDRRLQRLEWLLGIVDSLTSIQLRPEFNGREWTRMR